MQDGAFGHGGLNAYIVNSAKTQVVALANLHIGVEYWPWRRSVPFWYCHGTGSTSKITCVRSRIWLLSLMGAPANRP